ncbi:MAG: zinc ABC transporter substrate-binding protein [Acidobacteria bacterium]|nr:zinc ABC transporter substrate-binding protein [Acidobacteriota bacterium]
MSHRISRSRFVAGFVLLAGVAAPAVAAVRVVTTTTDLASIARAVGGDRVEVDSIAAGNQDPHFVDAKPSFLVKLKKADLFVQVGLELEIGWAPNLLANSRNAKIQSGGPGFVDASAGIAPLQIPTSADRSAGDIHPYGNPHYWLDPVNGKQIAANIAAGLERVDPDGAESYRANLAAFDARIDQAVVGWTAKMAAVAGVPIVAYHNSWPYFERRFGFKVVGFVEPKPGIPPSGKYVAELAESMKQQKVGVILMSTFYDQKTAELVARLSGAKVVTLSNSVDGLPGADDYFKLFDVDVGRLVDALKP